LTGLTVVVVVAGSTLSFAIDQQEEKASQLFFNPKEKLETISRENSNNLVNVNVSQSAISKAKHK
jgi:hypothetical protein